MRSFARRLDEALLLEMPHMFWYAPYDEEEKRIPGTGLVFRKALDFRFERRLYRKDPELTAKLSNDLYETGIVGEANSGTWVYFGVLNNRAIVREAALEEVEQLTHLPVGWLKHVRVDEGIST